MYLRCWGTFTLTKESLYFCLSYRGERREVGLSRARIYKVFTLATVATLQNYLKNKVLR